MRLLRLRAMQPGVVAPASHRDMPRLTLASSFQHTAAPSRLYALAYSLLNARPMTMRRISDVPAPISYSLALQRASCQQE